MPPLEGKIAVVTGASSGIGAATVKDLVAAGMIVAGLARRIDRVEALAKSLQGSKGSLSPIKCDVSSEEDVKKAFAWVEKHLGPPTALINNAGVFKPVAIHDMDVENLKTVLDTNVVGLAICAREAIKLMKKNDIEGTIININSIAGHTVKNFPSLLGYTTSKFAGRALSEGMKYEMADIGANIRITNLSPGLVESEMAAPVINNLNPSTASEYYLLASDVADCIHFVLEAPQRVRIPELTVIPKIRDSK